MTQKDTGGQAFPLAYLGHGHVEGMTLRDYFAGQALLEIMTDSRVESYQHAATEAYKMADAIIAARRETT